MKPRGWYFYGTDGSSAYRGPIGGDSDDDKSGHVARLNARHPDRAPFRAEWWAGDSTPVV